MLAHSMFHDHNVKSSSDQPKTINQNFEWIQYKLK